MEKKLDTSWFDLKKYEELKALDLYGWERQISARQDIRNLNFLSFHPQMAVRFFEDIKVCPIIEENDGKGRERWEKWRKADVNHPYNTNSVFNISAESLKLFSGSLLLNPPNISLHGSSNIHSYREKAKPSEAQPDLSSQNIDRANFRWPIPPTPLMRVESPELPLIRQQSVATGVAH